MKEVAPADIVIKTTVLFTAETLEPKPGCMAIRGNEICAVGSADMVQSFVGPKTEVIDAGDKLVMPGFNDSHMHFALASLQKDEDFCCNLLFLPSQEACVEAVRTFADEHPQNPWIYGQGWYSQAWDDPTDPDCTSLDALGIDRPIVLSDFSMHVVWCNTAAMKAVGIDRNTPTPEGGIIRHFDNGEPSGFLSEPQATNILLDVVLNKADIDVSLEKSMKRLNALGITAVGDMYPLGVNTPGIYDTYDQMARDGRGTLRISYYPALDAPMAESQAWRAKHHGDKVRMAGLKYILDGCPEAYTAYMHEPYLNAPQGSGYRGEPACNQETLDAMVLAADENGFDVRIHAIGDASATMIIDAVEKARAAHGANKGTRFEIEHTDNLKFEDIERMRRLGIGAAIQPQHPIGGFGQGFYEVALGEERRADMWRYREELDGGLHLGLGTDWPAVMSIDPIDTVYAAVTRSEFDGNPPEGHFRNNALTLGETLQAHTVGSAYVEGFERRVGTLSVGKLADVVILSGNPFEMNPMDLRELEVEKTIFDGRVVFSKRGE